MSILNLLMTGFLLLMASAFPLAVFSVGGFILATTVRPLGDYSMVVPFIALGMGPYILPATLLVWTPLAYGLKAGGLRKYRWHAASGVCAGLILMALPEIRWFDVYLFLIIPSTWAGATAFWVVVCWRPSAVPV